MSIVATRQSNGAMSPHAGAPPKTQNAAEIAAMTLENVWWLAEKVATTKMFPGLFTTESVFTLMMICQSRGLHPIEAIMRYDIIEGKPALKAATIQAEFQARGGRIRVIRTDAQEARAFFTHPLLPDGFEFHVTFEQFEKSGAIRGKDGIKKNWRENAADMLWWRLVSKAVRKIDPGIVVGIPSSEELRDEIDVEYYSAPQPEHRTTQDPSGNTIVVESHVPGQTTPGIDSRHYNALVIDAVAAVNQEIEGLAAQNGGEVPRRIEAIEVHKFLFNAAIQRGLHPGPMPTKLSPAVQELTKVYKSERDWLRAELSSYLEDRLRAVQEEVAAKQDVDAAEETQEPEKASATQQGSLLTRTREPGEEG